MPTSATPVQLVNPDTGIPYAASSGTPAATDANNNRRVVGDTTSGSNDSGSAPVKVAGFDGTAVRTIRTDNAGRLTTVLVDGNGTGLTSGMASSATTPAITSLTVSNFSRYWDGVASTWKRTLGDDNGAFSVSKGGSSIATGQVSVGTTATQVVAARAGRQKVTLSPTSSTVYYVGAGGVTTATGLYVPAGGTITLDTAAAIFAVGAAALTVSYIEFF